MASPTPIKVEVRGWWPQRMEAPRIDNNAFRLIHLQITKADCACDSDLASHSLCCDFKNQIKSLQQLVPTGFGEMKVSTCVCSHTRKLAA